MSAKEFSLCAFQERARDVIVPDAVAHLTSDARENRTFYLQGPTGCGKTAILSRGAMKKIHKELNGNVAFVWISIGKGNLDQQSKESISKHLNLSGIRVYSLDEALRACPYNMAGVAVVVNWESLNKEDKDGNPINIAMKDGEKTNFHQMCANTHANNVPIVLIIDESHSHADTEKSKRITDTIIAPNYTIKASATIGERERDMPYHPISYAEVVRSRLIKSEIITQEFATHQDGVPMAAAQLQKCIELAGPLYCPKMLVFVPNADKNGKNGEVDDILRTLRERFGWTEENGAVKLWFSGHNKNVEACKRNDDPTRVIITKEAIDTGIDIPSIQVIVQLRPTKDAKVQIQKIGRGLRTVEQIRYNNDLDKLFLYAFAGFQERIDWIDAEYFKEELNKKTIQVRDCFKDSVAKFPKITGYWRVRDESFIEQDEDDFAEEFEPVFRRIIAQHPSFDMKSDLTIDLRTSILNPDKDIKDRFEQIGLTNHIANERDVSILYTVKLKNRLKHTFRHKNCIENVIREELNLIDREQRHIFILNNLKEIERLIANSIKECEDKRANDTEPEKFPFQPPQSYQFNSETTDQFVNANFLYDKYVVYRGSKKNNWERNFEEFLVSSRNVLWWSINYDRQYKESFSVVYRDADKAQQNFFPDYIIMLNDGRILIVDVKGGDENKKAKKEALIEVLKGTEVIGGFVRPDDKGHFYIDCGKGEEPFEDLIEPKTQQRLF